MPFRVGSLSWHFYEKVGILRKNSSFTEKARDKEMA